MRVTLIGSLLLTLFVTSYALAAEEMTYFSCKITEPAKKDGKLVDVEVTVKFAVKKLDIYKGKGELVYYPGLDEEDDMVGAIFVDPVRLNKNVLAKMTNLNGQGGDLRIEGDDLRLFGDGDGYQFTDLVIWDVESGEADGKGEIKLEGYVRDYGSTYGNKETFKQFIKCKRSSKVL